MKKILSILIIILMTITLTACGKSNIGTYQLVEMEVNGVKADVDFLRENDINMELIIKDDTNAVIKIDGKEELYTYDDKVFTRKDEKTGEDISLPYTIEDDTITINKDSGKQVFKK